MGSGGGVLVGNGNSDNPNQGSDVTPYDWDLSTAAKPHIPNEAKGSQMRESGGNIGGGKTL
jgi:hypothetical protein